MRTEEWLKTVEKLDARWNGIRRAGAGLSEFEREQMEVFGEVPRMDLPAPKTNHETLRRDVARQRYAPERSREKLLAQFEDRAPRESGS